MKPLLTFENRTSNFVEVVPEGRGMTTLPFVLKGNLIQPFLWVIPRRGGPV